MAGGFVAAAAAVAVAAGTAAAAAARAVAGMAHLVHTGAALAGVEAPDAAPGRAPSSSSVVDPEVAHAAAVGVAGFAAAGAAVAVVAAGG